MSLRQSYLIENTNLQQQNIEMHKKNKKLKKRVKTLIEVNREYEKELQQWKEKCLCLEKHIKEQHEQYEEPCDNCGVILGEDVPIMCYSNEIGGDETLCSECYYDCEMWKTDENPDNEDEIEEAKRNEDAKRNE